MPALAPPTGPTLASVLPPEAARRYGVVPLSVDGDLLEVGAAEPVPASVLRDLALLTGKRIVPIAVDGAEVEAYCREAPDAVRSPHGTPQSKRRQNTPAPVTGHDGEMRPPLPSGGFGGTVVQQVDAVIRRAIASGASDIHVEPYEKRLRVRYRLDGVLQEAGDLPLAQREATVARLKVMAELDIAEKRRPQDGRIRVQHGERHVDLRVSTLPTGFGEKVVLRVLDRNGSTLDLAALGMEDDDLQTVQEALAAPHGMVLVTGPTGSGKTTTLYAALQALDRSALNVSTVEDPIEYDLPGVNQTRVRPEIGLTFAAALRAFLRQDPDVLLVGEIRDRETADVAARAALTGHLVLTTLHTNDAPGAVVRLADMGIEPYLVAATVRLVVAQRLVRQVCAGCRRAVEAVAAECERLGAPTLREVPAGAGCAACHGTGYAGRAAVFEVMVVDERIAALVAEEAPTAAIRHAARAGGMRTLREAGVALIQAGVTTPAEILRATA